MSYITTIRKLLFFCRKFGTDERSRRLCGPQINRNNIYSERVKEFWERSVCLPSFDVAFVEIGSLVRQENKSHYEFCRLIPEAVIQHDENYKNLTNVMHREMRSYYTYSSIPQ